MLNHHHQQSPLICRGPISATVKSTTTFMLVATSSALLLLLLTATNHLPIQAVAAGSPDCNAETVTGYTYVYLDPTVIGGSWSATDCTYTSTVNFYPTAPDAFRGFNLDIIRGSFTTISLEGSLNFTAGSTVTISGQSQITSLVVGSHFYASTLNVVSALIYSTSLTNGKSNGAVLNFKDIRVASTGYNALQIDQDLTACTVNIEHIYGTASSAFRITTATLTDTQVNIKSLNVTTSSYSMVTATHYGSTAYSICNSSFQSTSGYTSATTLQLEMQGGTGADLDFGSDNKFYSGTVYFILAKLVVNPLFHLQGQDMYRLFITDVGTNNSQVIVEDMIFRSQLYVVIDGARRTDHFYRNFEVTSSTAMTVQLLSSSDEYNTNVTFSDFIIRSYLSVTSGAAITTAQRIHATFERFTTPSYIQLTGRFVNCDVAVVGYETSQYQSQGIIQFSTARLSGGSFKLQDVLLYNTYTGPGETLYFNPQETTNGFHLVVDNVTSQGEFLVAGGSTVGLDDGTLRHTVRRSTFKAYSNSYDSYYAIRASLDFDDSNVVSNRVTMNVQQFSKVHVSASNIYFFNADVEDDCEMKLSNCAVTASASFYFVGNRSSFEMYDTSMSSMSVSYHTKSMDTYVGMGRNKFTSTLSFATSSPTDSIGKNHSVYISEHDGRNLQFSGSVGFDSVNIVDSIIYQFFGYTLTNTNIMLQNATFEYQFSLSYTTLRNTTISVYDSKLTVTSTTQAVYFYRLVGFEDSLIDFQNMSITYRSYYPMYLYQGDGMNYRFSNMRIMSTYNSYPLYFNQDCEDETQVPCRFEFSSTYLDTSFSMSITNYSVIVDVSNTSSAFSLTLVNSTSAAVSVRDVVQATSVYVSFYKCNNTDVYISNVSHSSASYPDISMRWGKLDDIPTVNHTAQLLNSRFDSLAVSSYNTLGGDNIDLHVDNNYFRTNTISGRLHINATFSNNTITQTSSGETFDTSNLDCSKTDVILSGIHDQGCHLKIINNTVTRSGSYINSYYALDLQFSESNEFSTTVVTGNNFPTIQCFKFGYSTHTGTLHYDNNTCVAQGNINIGIGHPDHPSFTITNRFALANLFVQGMSGKTDMITIKNEEDRIDRLYIGGIGITAEATGIFTTYIYPFYGNSYNANITITNMTAATGMTVYSGYNNSVLVLDWLVLPRSGSINSQYGSNITMRNFYYTQVTSYYISISSLTDSHLLFDGGFLNTTYYYLLQFNGGLYNSSSIWITNMVAIRAKRWSGYYYYNYDIIRMTYTADIWDNYTSVVGFRNYTTYVEDYTSFSMLSITMNGPITLYIKDNNTIGLPDEWKGTITINHYNPPWEPFPISGITVYTMSIFANGPHAASRIFNCNATSITTQNRALNTSTLIEDSEFTSGSLYHTNYATNSSTIVRRVLFKSALTLSGDGYTTTYSDRWANNTYMLLENITIKNSFQQSSTFHGLTLDVVNCEIGSSSSNMQWSWYASLYFHPSFVNFTNNTFWLYYDGGTRGSTSYSFERAQMLFTENVFYNRNGLRFESSRVDDEIVSNFSIHHNTFDCTSTSAYTGYISGFIMDYQNNNIHLNRGSIYLITKNPQPDTIMMRDYELYYMYMKTEEGSFNVDFEVRNVTSYYVVQYAQDAFNTTAIVFEDTTVTSAMYQYIYRSTNTSFEFTNATAYSANVYGDGSSYDSFTHLHHAKVLRWTFQGIHSNSLHIVEFIESFYYSTSSSIRTIEMSSLQSVNATFYIRNNTDHTTNSYYWLWVSSSRLRDNSTLYIQDNDFDGRSYGIYASWTLPYTNEYGSGKVIMKRNNFVRSVRMFNVDLIEHDRTNYYTTTAALTVSTNTNQTTTFEVINTNIQSGSLAFYNFDQYVLITNNTRPSTGSLYVQTGAGSSNVTVNITENYGLGRFGFQVSGNNINADVYNNDGGGTYFGNSQAAYAGGRIYIYDNKNYSYHYMTMNMEDMNMTIYNNEMYTWGSQLVYLNAMNWLRSNVTFLDNVMELRYYYYYYYPTFKMNYPYSTTESALIMINNIIRGARVIDTSYTSSYASQYDLDSTWLLRNNTFEAVGCACSNAILVSTSLNIDHDGSNYYAPWTGFTFNLYNKKLQHEFHINNSFTTTGSVTIQNYADHPKIIFYNVTATSQLRMDGGYANGGLFHMYNSTGSPYLYGDYSTNSVYIAQHISDISNFYVYLQKTKNVTFLIENMSTTFSATSYVYPDQSENTTVEIRNTTIGQLMIYGPSSDNSLFGNRTYIHIHDNTLSKVNVYYCIKGITLNVTNNAINRTYSSNNMIYFYYVSMTHTVLSFTNNLIDKSATPESGSQYYADAIYWYGRYSSSQQWNNDSLVEFSHNTIRTYGIGINIYIYEIQGHDMVFRMRNNTFVANHYSSYNYLQLSIRPSIMYEKNFTIDHDQNNRYLINERRGYATDDYNIYLSSVQDGGSQLRFSNSVFDQALMWFGEHGGAGTVYHDNCTINRIEPRFQKSQNTQFVMNNSYLAVTSYIYPDYSTNASLVVVNTSVQNLYFTGTSYSTITVDQRTNFTGRVEGCSVSGSILFQNRHNSTYFNVTGNDFPNGNVVLESYSRYDRATIEVSNNLFRGPLGISSSTNIFIDEKAGMVVWDNTFSTTSHAIYMPYQLANLNPSVPTNLLQFRRNRIYVASGSYCALCISWGQPIDYDDTNIITNGLVTLDLRTEYTTGQVAIANSVVTVVTLNTYIARNALYVMRNTTLNNYNIRMYASSNTRLSFDDVRINAYSASIIDFATSTNTTGYLSRVLLGGGQMTFTGGKGGQGNYIHVDESILTGQIAITSTLSASTLKFSGSVFETIGSLSWLTGSYSTFDDLSMLWFDNNTFRFVTGFGRGSYLYRSELTNATVKMTNNDIYIDKISTYPFITLQGTNLRLGKDSLVLMRNNTFRGPNTNNMRMLQIDYQVLYTWQGYFDHDESNVYYNSSMALYPNYNQDRKHPRITFSGEFTTFVIQNYEQATTYVTVKNAKVLTYLHMYADDTTSGVIEANNVTVPYVETRFGNTLNGTIYLKNVMTPSLNCLGRGATYNFAEFARVIAIDSTINYAAILATDYHNHIFEFHRCKIVSPTTAPAIDMASASMFNTSVLLNGSWVGSMGGKLVASAGALLNFESNITYMSTTFDGRNGQIVEGAFKRRDMYSWQLFYNNTYLGKDSTLILSVSCVGAVCPLVYHDERNSFRNYPTATFQARPLGSFVGAGDSEIQALIINVTEPGTLMSVVLVNCTSRTPLVVDQKFTLGNLVFRMENSPYRSPVNIKLLPLGKATLSVQNSSQISTFLVTTDCSGATLCDSNLNVVFNHSDIDHADLRFSANSSAYAFINSTFAHLELTGQFSDSKTRIEDSTLQQLTVGPASPTVHLNSSFVMVRVALTPAATVKPLTFGRSFALSSLEMYSVSVRGAQSPTNSGIDVRIDGGHMYVENTTTIVNRSLYVELGQGPTTAASQIYLYNSLLSGASDIYSHTATTVVEMVQTAVQTPLVFHSNSVGERVWLVKSTGQVTFAPVSNSSQGACVVVADSNAASLVVNATSASHLGGSFTVSRSQMVRVDVGSLLASNLSIFKNDFVGTAQAHIRVASQADAASGGLIEILSNTFGKLGGSGQTGIVIEVGAPGSMLSNTRVVVDSNRFVSSGTAGGLVISDGALGAGSSVSVYRNEFWRDAQPSGPVTAGVFVGTMPGSYELDLDDYSNMYDRMGVNVSLGASVSTPMGLFRIQVRPGVHFIAVRNVANKQVEILDAGSTVHPTGTAIIPVLSLASGNNVTIYAEGLSMALDVSGTVTNSKILLFASNVTNVNLRAAFTNTKVQLTNTTVSGAFVTASATFGGTSELCTGSYAAPTPAPAPCTGLLPFTPNIFARPNGTKIEIEPFPVQCGHPAYWIVPLPPTATETLSVSTTETVNSTYTITTTLSHTQTIMLKRTTTMWHSSSFAPTHSGTLTKNLTTSVSQGTPTTTKSHDTDTKSLPSTATVNSTRTIEGTESKSVHNNSPTPSIPPTRTAPMTRTVPSTKSTSLKATVTMAKTTTPPLPTTTTTTRPTLAPGAPTPKCPRPSVVRFPSGDLKDTDIQSTGVLINLTIAYPLEYINCSSTTLASMITFRVASYSGEVNGFDRTYGSGPHEWCTMPTLQTIMCQIPANGYYALTANEYIVATLANTKNLYPNSTSFWCDGERIDLMNTKVISTEIPGAAKFIKDGSVVAGGGAVVVGVLTGASTMDIQAVALLFGSDCGSSLDQQSTSLLRYFLSPFIDLGNMAVIIGNMCMIIFLAALQGGVATFFKYSRGISRADSWAAVRFPSLSYGVLSLFYMGLCYGVFASLKSGDTAEIVVGTLGLLVAIAVPGCVCYMIWQLFTAKFVQYTQFLSKPASRRWLYPLGFWDPPAMRLAYNNIVGDMCADREYFTVLPMVVSFLVTLIISGLPLSCVARLTFAALVFYTAAIVTIVGQYGRSFCMTLLNFFGYLLLGTLCIVMMLSMTNVTMSLVYGKLAVAMIQILLVIVRVTYKIAIMFLEHKYWIKFQRPELEGLDNNDVNAANSANPMLADILDDDDFFGSLDAGAAAVKKPAPKRKKKAFREDVEEMAEQHQDGEDDAMVAALPPSMDNSQSNINNSQDDDDNDGEEGSSSTGGGDTTVPIPEEGGGEENSTFPHSSSSKSRGDSSFSDTEEESEHDSESDMGVL